MIQHAHWTQAYLGEPWSHERDCWAFARQVWAQHFGLDVPELILPAHDVLSCIAAAQAAQADTDWIPVREGEERDGDAALIGRGDREPHHAGVWVDVGGRMRVLHCLRGPGVVSTDRAVLARLGLRVVRSWRSPQLAAGGHA